MKRKPQTRPPLPPACIECQAYGGLWREGPTGGMERCWCDRGRLLAAGLGRKRSSRRARSKFDGRNAAAGPDD